MRVTLFLSAAMMVFALPGASHGQILKAGATPSSDVVALADGGLQEALDTLPETITRIMERSGVPGMAVAVVHGGETVFLDGFGVRDLRTGEPVTPQTVFQVASLSKPISATIAAIAVSRGEVSWDDRVKDYLPAFALSDPYVTANATIGDFFAHRSGLPDAAGDALEDLGFDRAEIIDRLSIMPLDRFRISYHYANFGITIGAEAVAAAAGDEWEDLAEAYLYDPLGMASTSSRHEDFQGRANAATLHTFENGRFEALYERDADQQSPAGGVSSSARDLTIWLKALLAQGVVADEELFDASALLPALQPQIVSGRAGVPGARSAFYGYGFNVGVTASGRPHMGHSGAFLLGAATHFQILPEADLGIVVLSNGGPVGAVEAIAARFMDIVQFGAPSRDWFAAYNAVLGPLYRPVGDLAGEQRPDDPDAPADLESYTGRYDNAYFGPAIIEMGERGLVAKLGPEPERFELEHWSGDVFAISPRNENAPAGSLSSITFSDDHASFVIEYLNHNGLGTWTRSDP